MREEFNLLSYNVSKFKTGLTGYLSYIKVDFRVF